MDVKVKLKVQGEERAISAIQGGQRGVSVGDRGEVAAPY